MVQWRGAINIPSALPYPDDGPELWKLYGKIAALSGAPAYVGMLALVIEAAKKRLGSRGKEKRPYEYDDNVVLYSVILANSYALALSL
jgi:hypothetical protein